MIPALENLRNLKGPQFLHVVTKKGHGYQKAEQDPILYHGPGSFNPREGIVKKKEPGKKTIQKFLESGFVMQPVRIKILLLSRPQ